MSCSPDSPPFAFSIRESDCCRSSAKADRSASLRTSEDSRCARRSSRFCASLSRRFDLALTRVELGEPGAPALEPGGDSTVAILAIDLDLHRRCHRDLPLGPELLLASGEVVAAALELGREALEPLVALRELLFQLCERLSPTAQRLGDRSELRLAALDLGEAHVRLLGAVRACAQGLLGGVELGRAQLAGALSLIELGSPAVELGGLPSCLGERCLDGAAALRERSLGGGGRVGACRDRLLDALELSLAHAQLVGRARGRSLRLLLRALPGHQAGLSLRELAEIGFAGRELALALADLRAALVELRRQLIDPCSLDVRLGCGLPDLGLARRELALAPLELGLECRCGSRRSRLERLELGSTLRARRLLALECILRAAQLGLGAPTRRTGLRQLGVAQPHLLLQAIEGLAARSLGRPAPLELGIATRDERLEPLDLAVLGACPGELAGSRLLRLGERLLRLGHGRAGLLERVAQRRELLIAAVDVGLEAFAAPPSRPRLPAAPGRAQPVAWRSRPRAAPTAPRRSPHGHCPRPPARACSSPRRAPRRARARALRAVP